MIVSPTPTLPTVPSDELTESSAGFPWTVHESTATCPACDGEGSVEVYVHMAPISVGPYQAACCESCRGCGRIEDLERCDRCGRLDENALPRLDNGTWDSLEVCACSEDAMNAWHEAGRPAAPGVEDVVEAIVQNAMGKAPRTLEALRWSLRWQAGELRGADEDGEHVETLVAQALEELVASMEVAA